MYTHYVFQTILKTQQENHFLLQTSGHFLRTSSRCWQIHTCNTSCWKLTDHRPIQSDSNQYLSAVRTYRTDWTDLTSSMIKSSGKLLNTLFRPQSNTTYIPLYLKHWRHIKMLFHSFGEWYYSFFLNWFFSVAWFTACWVTWELMSWFQFEYKLIKYNQLSSIWASCLWQSETDVLPSTGRGSSSWLSKYLCIWKLSNICFPWLLISTVK